MQLHEITRMLESWAPLRLQASYDNSGLQVGDANAEVTKALVALDVTEEVIDEAIRQGANMIITHHPIIFKPLKRLTGANLVERCVLKAIENKIALYAAHTNLDSIQGGVSHRMAQELGLEQLQILQPRGGELMMLVVYVPENHAQGVSDALFAAGAGQIGQYDQCQFASSGQGSFRALEGANPNIGAIGERESVDETRLEFVVSKSQQRAVHNAMIQAHPYESVAHHWIVTENVVDDIGYGIVGQLPQPKSFDDFVNHVKSAFGVKAIRHTAPVGNMVQKVALCGGAGADLIGDAKRSGADVYLTGDVTYHRFFESENRLSIMDIGHFESEQYTVDLLIEKIRSEFPNFAVLKSEQTTNPVIIS